MAILVKKLDRRTDVLKRLKFYVRPVTFGNVDGFKTNKAVAVLISAFALQHQISLFKQQTGVQTVVHFYCFQINITRKDVLDDICLLNL
jgi:hypothetical protein